MRQALLRGALLDTYTTLPVAEYERLIEIRPDAALRLVRFFEVPGDGRDAPPPAVPRDPRTTAACREAIEACREAVEARREAVRVLDALVPPLTRGEIGRRLGVSKWTVENDLRAMGSRR